MTDMDKTAGVDDPQAIIDALRDEIRELEDDTAVLPDAPTDDESWADRHLTGVVLDYPAAITAAADKLISRHEPDLEARDKMIEAARRALEDRRRETGLLPVVLRAMRERDGLTVGEIAERSHLSEEDVRDLESGSKEVDLGLPVATTVAWISAVTVDRARAVAALRRSLQVGFTGETSLAAGDSDHPINVEDYVNRVIAALSSREEGSL